MPPLLEQQELIETPPERQVVMPLAMRGKLAWWGIDVSTRSYAVGYVGQDGARGVHGVRLGAANDNEGERLTRFTRQLRLLLETMLDNGVPPPAVVFVEQPSGATVMPILWYAAGIALQVSYEVINERCGWVPRVESVPPATWKKIACGRGNIYKPKSRSGEDYGVAVWARESLHIECANWDEADACGVAECARRSIGIAG